MTQPYEASAIVSDTPGTTVYDAGFPIAGAPVFKGTDTDLGFNLEPDPIVKVADLDYEIGGEPGAVNRQAYVLHGIDVLYDAHDFRGDHPVIPRREVYGNYGDVGNTDDYSSQYAEAIASNGYPDMTTAETWDAVSQGF